MNRMSGCTSGEFTVLFVMFAVILAVTVAACWVLWGQDRDR